MTRQRRRKELTGERFGKLVVRRFFETRGKHAFWLCDCDCGEQTVVRGTSLRGGNTLSCGCLKNSLAARRMSDMVDSMDPSEYGWGKRHKDMES